MTSYDPSAALCVVDVQNDFADPSGSLYVTGGESVVPFANQEIDRARKAGALVVYTQDWHPPDTPHFAKDGGVWPVHCVRDTPGAAFHRDLIVDGPVVRKGTGGEDGYSGFTVADPVDGERSPTELAALLKERGITRLIVAGLATDYCVKATTLDAVSYGFEAVALRRGIRAVELEKGDGDRAIAEMLDAGVTVE